MKTPRKQLYFIEQFYGLRRRKVKILGTLMLQGTNSFIYKGLFASSLSLPHPSI